MFLKGLCVKGRAPHCLKPSGWSAPLGAVNAGKASWDSALAQKRCIGTSTVGVWAGSSFIVENRLEEERNISSCGPTLPSWQEALCSCTAGHLWQQHSIAGYPVVWLGCSLIQGSCVECKLRLSRVLSMPGSGILKKKNAETCQAPLLFGILQIMHLVFKTCSRVWMRAWV